MQYDTQSEKFKAQLLRLAGQPGNKECADCSSKSVQWACFNHGIFVCIKCSGIHRGLGRHISKVKSLTLDKWTVEEMAGMCGNVAANSEYLYNLPSGLRKPDENDDTGRRKWIEKKYVKQEWRRRADQPPGQGAMEALAAEQSTSSCFESCAASPFPTGPSQVTPQSMTPQPSQLAFQTAEQPYQSLGPQPMQYQVPTYTPYSFQQPTPAASLPGQPAPSAMPSVSQQSFAKQQELIQQIMLQQQQYQQQLSQCQWIQSNQPMQQQLAMFPPHLTKPE